MTNNQMTIAYEHIYRWSTLQAAWERVEESDGCAGVDGVGLDQFAARLDANLAQLGQELKDESYTPLPLLRFYVPKDDGGQRALAVLAVRDRVAQHAVIRVIGPLLEAEFEACSYAYRKGRSVGQALDQIERLRDEGYRWVVDADITTFFDAIDHQLLLGRVREIIGEERLVQLIHRWMTPRIYDGETFTQMTQGVPQGAPLSPWLANLYLDSFDEQMLKAGYRLVRYADDFVVLCRSQAMAQRALELTQEVLTSLRLTLHQDKTRITSFDQGFKYLGATFIKSFRWEKPRRKPGQPEPRAGVIMPPPIPLLCPPMGRREPFNPSLRDALVEAVQDLEPGPAPSFLRPPGQTPDDLRPAPPASPSPPPEDAPVSLPEPSAAPPPTADSSGPSTDAELDWHAQLPERPLPSLHTLRTLYVLEHGARLRCEDERLLVYRDDVELLSLPAFKVDQVVVFSHCQITLPAMKFCLMHDIPIILLSSRGRYYGAIESTANDNVLLQRDQFLRLEEADFCLALARELVRGKILNCRTLLQRRQRRQPTPSVQEPIEALARIESNLDQATTLDELRGYEGAAAAAYFRALPHCFKLDWGFRERTRRPPRDPINALLSFGYTLLFYNLYALVRAHGLSPHVGYLHALGHGHPALCSDLIEEFRAPLIDSLVIETVNEGRFRQDEFHYEATGAERGCFLGDDGCRRFLRAFEARMNSELQNPHTGIRATWRGQLDLQIQQLIRVLRRQQERYQPFLIR
jgi:CRISPR-associated protein Cas1